MESTIYGAIEGNRLVAMTETTFAKELDLQDFLSRHPALLAGDQMNPSDPRRFVLITAEAGIAISQDGGAYFSLDHLFVDQDGILTLVEVKRSTDTRVRREVFGQMLDYAANAVAHWQTADLRATFYKRCKNNANAPIDPIEELAVLGRPEMSVPGGSDELFWTLVEANLKKERLRLIFLSDKILPETLRIIEFLNRQMQLTEVYAVEVRQYTGGNLKTLVPRVLNPSQLQVDRRAATSASKSRGEMWTKERFFDDLMERCGSDAVLLFRNIEQWAEHHQSVEINYGSGKAHGSLQVTHKINVSKPGYRPGDTVFMTLWSSGDIEIEFQYIKNRAIFSSDEARRELYRRITESSTIVLAEEIDRRPNIKWQQVGDSSNLQALLRAMEWTIEMLNSELLA